MPHRPANAAFLTCNAWVIAADDRFPARAALRAAVGYGDASGPVRASLNEVLAAARTGGLDGEDVPVRPTPAEWRKSGQ